jgi:ParB-like chromosome segregation protein Spo0J
MTDQPALINLNESKSKLKSIRLADLPANEDLICEKVESSDPLVTDMAARGQLAALKLADLGDGRIFVVAGSRRIQAARILFWHDIRAEITPMTLQDAMLARSAENNRRSPNDLADIDTINYVVEHFPSTANPKTISYLTGINIGRVKQLLKAASLPRVIVQEVKAGHISESTMLALSKQPKSRVQEALKIVKERKAEVEAKIAEGKQYKRTPVFLANSDIRKIQQARVEATVSSQLVIPDFESQIVEKVYGYALMTPDYEVITPIQPERFAQEDFNNWPGVELWEVKIVSV